MLTFEDFFAKKKIDLIQLQMAEPVLFAEFSKHYPLMGEKSFDHSKKYWFNHLRRTYPLQEIKSHPVSAEAITPTAVQGVAVAAAQNINAGIERPKFKEDNLPALVAEDVSKQEVSLAEEEKQITEVEPAKPAFKPRFNPKNMPTTKVEAEQQSENNLPETEPVKPAFKPRFNMHNIKKDAIKTASNTEVQDDKLESEDLDLQESPKPDKDQTEIVVKPAFKPRFNPKNIPKQVSEPLAEIEAQKPETKDEESELQSDLQLTENQPIKTVSEIESTLSETDINQTEPEIKSEKTVYKPRFKMNNIPKPPPSAD